MSLKAGKEALLRKHYTEAIAILNEYCQDHPDPDAKDYIQAKMWLVKAYQRSGRADKAIAICEQLEAHSDPQVQVWLYQSLITLRQQLEEVPPDPRYVRNDDVAAVIKSKPNRYRKRNVALGIAPSLKYSFWFAMIATVLLVVGLVMAFWFWLISLMTLVITSGWWTVGMTLTAITCILLFFMSPWLIEVTQKQYHRTQWITLADLDEKAPEAVEIIEHFCEARNLEIPRLGWIDEDTPVAFTYGILPNSARIVVSRGLFLNLADDEIAAVYAHQLGHIANWSFAVTTFASAPMQIVYLLYVNLSRYSYRAQNAKNALRFVAAIANFLYHLSSYLVFFVSRTSAYISDHFAAEATGNPNAVSRALTQMARAIANQNQLGQPPSRLLQSTRALGICDYQTAITIGIAFEILYAGQSQQNVYRVFLWELFNPWSNWTEFHSTHPLIGKRIQRANSYAKQLGLIDEYDFTRILQEGKTLSKGKLYRNFTNDLLIEMAPYLGVAIGLLLAHLINPLLNLYNNWLPLSFMAIGLGIGLMLQGSFRYPDYRRVADTDLVSLISDPYASTLRGMPAQIPGELIGYSRANNQIGYYLKLEDQAGVIYLNYLPNFKGLLKDREACIKQLERLMNESAIAIGWFRRGNIPILDLASLQPILPDAKGLTKTISGYHQYWNNISSSAIVLAGLILLAVTSLL